MCDDLASNQPCVTYTHPKLASNAPVTDSDLDALLPDEGFETLAKPAAPEKNAAVTDADLDSILPDEGYEKNDAQPEG